MKIQVGNRIEKTFDLDGMIVCLDDIQDKLVEIQTSLVNLKYYHEKEQQETQVTL